MKRYLENTTGKSHKFWQANLAGQVVRVQYGKISEKDCKTVGKAFKAK